MRIDIELDDMRKREILDRFTKNIEDKYYLPKFIDGDFMRLHYWVTEKRKGFNRMSKRKRIMFWEDLKKICKKHRIGYSENEKSN